MIEKDFYPMKTTNIQRMGGQIWVLAIIALWGMGRSCWAGDESGQERYALRFQDSGEMVKSLGWHQVASVYEQEGDKPMVIEAEDSSCVDAASGKGMVADPEASGGRCLAFVNRLENRLVVATAGDYQAWYRAYFPGPGNWMHIEQMDDEPGISHTDSESGPVKQWLWVKGPVYKLEKGRHVWLFPLPTAWCGGARLDKLVLALKGKWTPEGKGPEASKRCFAQKAEMESNRVALREFKHWRLELEQEANGGKVEVDYSCDRGKKWEQWQAGHDYAVTPEGPRVMFRVRLTAGAGVVSPRFRNAALVGVLKDTQPQEGK
jgi:hypothetical protein